MPTAHHGIKLREKVQNCYEMVRKHMKLKQEWQKTLYDRLVRRTPLKIGDLVWLHSPAVPRGQSHKLHRPWQGPFTIVKVINDVTYRIQCKKNLRKRFVVHYDFLKPYCETHQADDHQPEGKPTNNNQVVKEPQTNRPMIDEDDEYILVLLSSVYTRSTNSTNTSKIYSKSTPTCPIWGIHYPLTYTL